MVALEPHVECEVEDGFAGRLLLEVAVEHIVALLFVLFVAMCGFCQVDGTSSLSGRRVWSVACGPVRISSKAVLTWWPESRD